MARTARTSPTIDTGQPALHRHRSVRLELTGHGHAVRARVTDTSELDRLRTRELLTEDQHAAGERLLRLLHVAHMIGCPTSRLVREARSSGPTIAAAEAFAAVGQVMASLPPAERAALLALLVDDARPDAAGLDLVRAGLDRLGADLPARTRAEVPAVW